jgi:histone deacetylase 6
LGGQVYTSERAKVVDVLMDVFPQIEQFIASKLNPAESRPLSNGHTTMGEGPAAGANGVNGDAARTETMFMEGNAAPAIMA